MKGQLVHCKAGGFIGNSIRKPAPQKPLRCLQGLSKQDTELFVQLAKQNYRKLYQICNQLEREGTHFSELIRQLQSQDTQFSIVPVEDDFVNFKLCEITLTNFIHNHSVAK